jgi:phage shock protein C
MSAVKKLLRPKKGRVIAGVARAFAIYFNLDIALVRIILTLLLLPGGFPGIIFYIICWIFIPSGK